jgi:hypothetical protein
MRSRLSARNRASARGLQFCIVQQHRLECLYAQGLPCAILAIFGRLVGKLDREIAGRCTNYGCCLAHPSHPSNRFRTHATPLVVCADTGALLILEDEEPALWLESGHG